MTKIDTVKARNQLTPRREPYWSRLTKGSSIGYRKTKSGPGIWQVRIQEEGTTKKKTRSLGEFADAADGDRYDLARKEAQAFVNHLNLGGSSEEITVGDAALRYVAEQERLGRGAAARDYRRRFEQWLFSEPALANTLLSKLKIGQIKAWRDKLVATPAKHQNPNVKVVRPKAATTVNRHIAVFRAALNLAKRDGYATGSIWESVLLPIDAEPNRRNVYLDAVQRRALIDNAGDDLAPFLLGLCLLPLRPGALAKLTVADLDCRHKTLTIGKDKAGCGRVIPLPEATFKFLVSKCTSKLPTARIFTRADGQSWHKDNWKKPIAGAVKAAELPKDATAYSLRHSTITDLVGAGLDILQVAKLAGTSVMMIEKYYGHLRRDAATAALAKLVI